MRKRFLGFYVLLITIGSLLNIFGVLISIPLVLVTIQFVIGFSTFVTIIILYDKFRSIKWAGFLLVLTPFLFVLSSALVVKTYCYANLSKAVCHWNLFVLGGIPISLVLVLWFASWITKKTKTKSKPSPKIG
jgi:hypothetical protein